MQKVILFGATGHLGKEIAKELVRRGYDLTIAVRSEEKAKAFSAITSKYIVADVCDSSSLKSKLAGQQIVISALGKSVSLKDRSKPGFTEVDYEGNKNILAEARQTGVTKFVYVSAFHAEKYPHLTYFKVHHEFSELLKQSGINYSIIKPPALFSAFFEMIEMAEKGRLMNIGTGDKKTNPIFEGDLAKIVVESITQDNSTIEAGGQHIYTRRQINEIVQEQVKGKRKLRTIPVKLVTSFLPLLKVFSRNMYDKFSFYLAVMQEDTLAPLLGSMKFEDYISLKLREAQGKDSNKV